MAHRSPTTRTTDEQRLILRATVGNVGDHTIISLALGTGIRLAEIVGLDVGDVFAPDGTPRVRVRVRMEIAKGGRAADVFLPDRLVAKPKLVRTSPPPLHCSPTSRTAASRSVGSSARGRRDLPVPRTTAHRGDERVPGVEAPRARLLIYFFLANLPRLSGDRTVNEREHRQQRKQAAAREPAESPELPRMARRACHESDDSAQEPERRRSPRRRASLLPLCHVVPTFSRVFKCA